MNTELLNKAASNITVKKLLGNNFSIMNRDKECILGNSKLRDFIEEPIMVDGKFAGSVRLKNDNIPDIKLLSIIISQQYKIARYQMINELCSNLKDALSSINSLNKVGKIIVNAVSSYINIENFSVILSDISTDNIYCADSFGKIVLGEVEKSIIDLSLKKNEPQYIENIYNEKKFDGKLNISASFMCIPLFTSKHTIGALVASSSDMNNLSQDSFELFKAMSTICTMSLERALSYRELNNSFFKTVFTFADTIEKRDTYAFGHTKRVIEYSLKVGEFLKLPEDELETLKFCAALHDIGKIGIKNSLLIKQNQLTEEEFEIMKMHTLFGEQILKEAKVDKDIINGVKYHHEWFNGNGYPENIKGNRIPIYSRIISVCDAFDSMTTDHSYKKALNIEKSIEELKKNSGTQFDPEIIKAFLKIFSK